VDKGSLKSLQLDRLSEGGYLVSVGNREDQFGRQFLFAATSLDDALKFMRDIIHPIPATETKIGD
jgi:hypothetical protein